MDSSDTAASRHVWALQGVVKDEDVRGRRAPSGCRNGGNHEIGDERRAKRETQRKTLP